MESSRRPFDRSRDQPGPKKPRLMEQLGDRASNNPSVRSFPQRQVTSSASRFRTNDRDLERINFDRGGYQPQPLAPHQELVHQYKTALAELTFNSKPIITNLTIIAGENQIAAKAIAATVCANIIEVPSEQKLPSLYLLDSIVKNIGRDYIKYFAGRLPEVFCKVYRQVDPSLHQSMRHLFGTWRGVFPPQTLQTIEKELGFAPAVNGSASASATLRSGSQSLPPQSIHVNPKYYLERQCLQQSGRTKGVVDDMTGATANSNEDPERADRALGAARQWNNERTYRDALNDPVPENSIVASYGGNEYGSDISRNLGSGMGRAGSRVTELGRDKSSLKSSSGVAGTISGKRNGFSLRHNFSSTEAHLQPTQQFPSIQNNVMSSSWKNSGEEEFMWDEMHSGLTGHGAPKATNNGSKDPCTNDDENLEVEDPLQIRNPFGGNVDMEISTEYLATDKQLPASRRHPSLSWKLQEQHSVDELDQKPGQSDGFVFTQGLKGRTISSAARMGNRPFLPNATIGLAGTVVEQFHSMGAESPSGQPPLGQESSSPPASVHYHPYKMQDLAKQNRPQTLKTSKFLGGLQSQYIKDSLPTLPSNDQVGNLPRSQQKELQGPFSSTKTFQPQHPQLLGSSHTEVMAKTEKSPLSKVSLAIETPEQSSTSSMEDETVKSGIFSNMPITRTLPTTTQDTRNFPSKLGVRPTRSGGPSPAKLISSVSAITSPSSLGSHNDSSSALPEVPQRKSAKLPIVSPLPPPSSNVSSTSAQTSSATNNTANSIANLLSSLVAKGLISAETESPPKVASKMQTRLEDQSKSVTTSSSLPVASVSGSAAVLEPSTKDKEDDTAKTPISLSESTSTEIRDFIGFEFKPRLIRELHPCVIKGLFDDLPHQCSVCGLRLKFQEEFNRHLEWHATREGEQNGSRRWYLKSSDWVDGKAYYPSEHECADSVDDTYSEEEDKCQEDAMVPADENQCLCVLCGELFEDFYSQGNGEWMFKGAVYMTNSDSNSDLEIGNASTASGPVIHARCLSELHI
ncbi:PREDICTED: pre-mRNA cleavage complex 2 protein Pcf11-like isoform X2 [Lupinus angustifolius]|uniref:pre-mRNA cleavage complex 2 protein Pcf11-like isoform X2 n=1 Tax=Lupinus angustifolius TaxID=3871 RepID=UPI00092ECB60|nr:PREDICTED: pre-mRNA cleavage complex 2 protein Pcf11-like isoform X2 [Lupinus angustifolius]